MVFSSLFNDSQKKRKAIGSNNHAAPNKKLETGNCYHSKIITDCESNGRKKKTVKESNKHHPIPKGLSQHQQRPRKVPPSIEALQLSEKLKFFSKQKCLDQALALYWESIDRVDQHHACIVVDCAARCGDVDAAERIVEHLEHHQHQVVSIETQTALLKGYSHAGRMKPAMELFRQIKQPNVRTLNTLLRGCLWTAATPDAISGEIWGGVISSEEAWDTYTKSFPDDAGLALDVSSYEYSISLLCQALRLTEAEERVVSFRSAYSIRIKGTASVQGGDQASLETMAVLYLGLSRAYGLLNHSSNFWKNCQLALSAIKRSRELLLSITGVSDHTTVETKSAKKKKQQQQQPGASGGKRSWRVPGSEQDMVRHSSNVAFRTHRLSELESEVRSLLRYRHGKEVSEIHAEDYFQSLQTRLLCFSGGGTTDSSATQDRMVRKNDILRCDDHLVAAWLSFGLSEFSKMKEDPELMLKGADRIDPSWISQLCGFSEVASPVLPDGTVDFAKVFQNPKQPLDIEIGAGYGSWIVQQAKQNTDRNYVAVELRADRVSQIFARGILEGETPIKNLCVIGSECGRLFCDRIPAKSVSNIFANHPEPPTQTHGENESDLHSIMKGGKEPAHMLNSVCIVEMAKSLKPKHGKIVVVTDNHSFARFLAATFAKAIRHNPKLLKSLKPSDTLLSNSTLRHMEVFENLVDLYEGRPDHNIGHAKSDGSYFDRLWRTGAGSHSERRARYVILIQRC